MQTKHLHFKEEETKELKSHNSRAHDWNKTKRGKLLLFSFTYVTPFYKVKVVDMHVTNENILCLIVEIDNEY